MVALHAADGGVDDVDGGAVLLDDAVVDTLNGRLTGVGVADDAALAYVETASFELRLDEKDGFTLPASFGRAESSKDCR